MFPKISSPCPLKTLQLLKSGNFNCSVCHRQVHDLSAMTVEERKVFLSQCQRNVCVSYRVSRSVKNLSKYAAAGLFAVTASGLAVPAGAQMADATEEYLEVIIVGGVDHPELKALENESPEVSGSETDTLPLIPVIEEGEIEDESYPDKDIK